MISLRSSHVTSQSSKRPIIDKRFTGVKGHWLALVGTNVGKRGSNAQAHWRAFSCASSAARCSASITCYELGRLATTSRSSVDLCAKPCAAMVSRNSSNSPRTSRPPFSSSRFPLFPIGHYKVRLMVGARALHNRVWWHRSRRARFLRRRHDSAIGASRGRCAPGRENAF